MGKTDPTQPSQHFEALFRRTGPIIDVPNPVAMEVDEARHGSMLLIVSSSVSSSSPLTPLFSRHRVLVCVGAGGVGKTTVAAALALSAASAGKRTLCLTIDPARRLAQSLGLESFPLQEMEVSRQFLQDRGFSLAAPLTVMMLDARATFDGLIRQFSTTPQEAQRIIDHKVYHHLASNLAGTQAYMAMEKVLAVLDDDRYDLIVLDTPPSARALDFFDAPKKMADILDSPATRALVQTLDTGRKLRFGLLSAGIRRAMQGLEKVTGTSLIFDVADLLANMNGLFDGFASRATSVSQRMRRHEFGYVLVTTAATRTLEDAEALAHSMRDRQLDLDAVAVNRVVQPGLADAEPRDLDSYVGPGQLSEEGVRAIVDFASQLARTRASQLERVQSLIRGLDPSVLVSYLPAFAEDVHEPERLMAVARVIAPAQVRTTTTRSLEHREPASATEG